MTKKEMFIAIANVAEVAANEEMMAFINHELELLDKRNTSRKKGMTANQKANIEVKDVIADVLNENGERMTVTELQADDRLNAFTNQKISALLRQMIADGIVAKVIEGKKAYFALA